MQSKRYKVPDVTWERRKGTQKHEGWGLIGVLTLLHNDSNFHQPSLRLLLK